MLLSRLSALKVLNVEDTMVLVTLLRDRFPLLITLLTTLSVSRLGVASPSVLVVLLVCLALPYRTDV